MFTRRKVLSLVTAAIVASAGLPAAHAATDTTSFNPGDVKGVSAVVERSSDPRIAAWQDLQFGLFMHWGVYSMYEGYYEGKQQHMGYPEQIKAWEKIPREKYLEMAATMTADRWDPAQICSSAKAAGMKYVMLTSKHHDGFAMWDTKTTDYNIVKATAYAKDPIKLLQTECNKIGVKLAFYFSIIDWEKHEAEPYGNVNKISAEHHQYNLAQIEELLTNYGPIAEFWFDMGGPTPQQSQEMADKVRSLQPGVTVVNSRVWNNKGDFEVGGDNYVPSHFQLGPWESIRSVFPRCWSYCTWPSINRSDSSVNYKASEAVNNLIAVISGGGQFAYNIGPKGDGSIDPFDQKILDAIAQWQTRHPHAVQGAKATWFPIPNWGRVTANGNALYLFPKSWTDGSQIHLGDLANRVTKVTIDGTDTELPFERDGLGLSVTMRGETPDPLRSVIKVELDGEPMMVPSQTVELNNGLGTATSRDVVQRAGAKNSTVILDTFVIDRGGKSYPFMDVEFKTLNSGPADATKFRVTVGDKSVVVTGAEIKAGPISGFSLPANQVTRIKVEREKPDYYADPIGIAFTEVNIVATENEQEAIAPSFTTQPQSVSTVEGRDATFSVVTAGRPKPEIQWYKVVDGTETKLEDETAASLSVMTTLEMSGTQYFARITNSAGTVDSDKATLIVTKRSENLALEQPAMQSTTGWGGVATRANDGNTDGVWDHSSVSHTGGYEANPWWQVDLGGMFKIKTVNVWNRDKDDDCSGNPCANRLQDFYVIAAKEAPLPGTELDYMQSSDDFKVIKVDGIGGYPSTVDFGDFPARYIQVRMQNVRHALALAEVEVFGKSVNEAPSFEAIRIDGNPESDFTIAGDGQSRTIMAKVGTSITLHAPVSGFPDPKVKWQRLENGQWIDVEDQAGEEFIFQVQESDKGVMIRAVATNDIGEAISQNIVVELKKDEPIDDGGSDEGSDDLDDTDPVTPVEPTDPTKPQTPETSELSVATDLATVEVGKDIVFTAKGYKGGEEVTFTVYSTPVKIGVVTADTQGVATFRWSVPAGFEFGQHTVVATGTTSGEAKAEFTVVKAEVKDSVKPTRLKPMKPQVQSKTMQKDGDVLAHTGMEADILAGGALLVLAGAFILIMRRRMS